MDKAGRKLDSFPIHSLNRFNFLKKCLRVAGFPQSGALYTLCSQE